MESRVCPDCGTKNSDTNFFNRHCVHCNYRFASDPAADIPTPKPFPAAKILGACGIGLGIWFFASAFRPDDHGPSEKEQIAPRSTAARSDNTTLSARPEPKHFVSIKKLSWSTGGFGAIMMANFTIQNGNDFPVKDIQIECLLSANSGTKIDSAKQTIFEIVPANSAKTFHEVNMGFIRDQAKKASCEVVSVQ